MTVKLVVVYGKPEDPAAWDKHYHEVHMPIASKIPGIQRAEVAQVVGDSPYHVITELYFDDMDALGAGFGSEAGMAAEVRD
jgi:uncharacterized protein (TIGR02118 family)